MATDWRQTRNVGNISCVINSHFTLPIERLGALDNVVLKATSATETKAGTTRENTSRLTPPEETPPDSRGY